VKRKSQHRICLSVLLIVVISTIFVTAQARAEKPALAQRIKDKLKIANYKTVSVVLPTGLPDDFTTTVEIDGAPRKLKLKKHSIRGSNFELLIQVEGGELIETDPGPVITYRGYVEDSPETLVAATLLPSGIKAKLFPKKGTGWSISPMKEVDHGAGRQEHIVFSQADSEPPDFHGDNEPIQIPGEPLISPYSCGMTLPDALVKSSLVVDCLLEAEFAVDLEYYYYTWMGSSVAACNAAVATTINEMNIIYNRSLGVSLVQGRTIIRTDSGSCPYYSSTSSLELLGLLAGEWTTNQSDSTHDVCTIVNGYRFGGGWAYVATVGSGGYSSVCPWPGGVFTEILKHEMGHNFGALDMHANCLQDYTIMCGNAHWYFADETQQSIQIFIDTLTCLDPVAGAAGQLVPFAALDEIILDRSAAAENIDVMANDSDGNCETISIDSYDSVSTFGGNITQSGDELVYDPSTASIVYGVNSNADTFYYNITDGTDTDMGWIRASIASGKQAAYFKLEETTGTSAVDSSGNGLTGTLNGTTFDVSSTPGIYGNALLLDGNDDSVSFPAMNLNSNAVTITAWIKRNGNQPYYRGILYHRTTATMAGISWYGSTNRLGYTWGGYHWTWNSGLTVPNATWTFVALVVEPTQATLYMDSGGGLSSAVNTAAHVAQAFEDNTYIGRDVYHGTMIGAIDDVRIYNYILNTTELADVRDGQSVGGAFSNPENNTTNVPTSGVTLKWGTTAAATSYDVYFGLNNPPPFIQNQTEMTYYAGSMNSEATYYWKVDVKEGASTVPGTVVSFDTLASFRNDHRIGYYSMDTADIDGDIVVDRGVPYYHGVIHGDSTTVTGKYSQAMSFDGSGDYVEITQIYPRMVQSDFSVSFWVKTSQTGSSTGNWSNGKGLVDAAVVYDFFDWGTVLYGNKFAFGTYIHKAVSTTAINNNVWHHCVATRAADGTMKVYVDGGPAEATVAGNSTNMDYSPYIVIGCSNDGRDNFFNGLIDDVEIWSRVLTQGEIDAIYTDGPGGVPTDDNPPEFIVDPFTASGAREGNQYSDFITGQASDPDPGDTITYSKFNGPTWLNVASDGTLSGKPADDDTGLNEFIIRARDNHGAYDNAAMEITVDNTYSGQLGMPDFASFAQYWFDMSCAAESPCDPADINADGKVDFDDLLMLGINWLYDPELGLIGHWTLDQTADDSSSNQRDGTIYGTPTWEPSGKIGDAILLDGIDDYVQIAGYKGVTGSASRTVTAWIKMDETGGGDIVGWGRSPEAGERWAFRADGNGFISIAVNSGWIAGDTDLRDGNWHHVAVVLVDDGSPSVNEIKLYVDGIEESTTYGSTQAINTPADADVAIGAFLPSPDYFQGLVDDVRIYNRALQVSEIELLYSQN